MVVKKAAATKIATKKWSQRVTETSHALSLDKGVFALEDPAAVAASLMRSARRSYNRKSDALQSAMSMLTFYINRAGKRLPDARRSVLERAKDSLRNLAGIV